MATDTDFYALDDLLSDEEAMVRDTVRRFVDDKFLPVVADHFEAGTFPMDLVPTIADMGLLGMHLDGYGCAGASATAYGIACRELERGDSGLRSFVSVPRSDLGASAGWLEQDMPEAVIPTTGQLMRRLCA